MRDVTVKISGGAYVAFGGQHEASCTFSAEVAVQRLAKLTGYADPHFTLLDKAQPGQGYWQRWRIADRREVLACSR